MKNTMYADNAISGISSAMEIMTTSVHVNTILKVALRRSGAGASSFIRKLDHDVRFESEPRAASVAITGMRVPLLSRPPAWREESLRRPRRRCERDPAADHRCVCVRG